MLCDVEWAEDGTYVPGEEFSPERFFNDGLMNSTEFDLKLGYFSSAAISVLADGFATFISRGGFMRLIINHIVSPKDKEAITDGLMGNVIDCTDLSNFQYLKTTFDDYQEQFFRCLAYMISKKRIDIRIIKPRGKKGIAHTKTGQFRDGDSVTAFTGSANFTISGLFNNIEDINIVRSDSLDVMVQNRIAKQKKDFDSIMFGEKKGIDYLSPKDLVEAISCNYGDSDIEELLDVEAQLHRIRKERAIREKKRINEACENIEIEPQFPFEAPFPYQTKALEEWKNNGYKGLFNMATGTGKTITSLNCLLSLYEETGCYKAIILVPTIPLVDQWEKECRKFYYEKIYKVSSKSDWKSSITRLTRAELLYPDRNSYIVISTYASFVREATFERLSELSLDTLLIADEAHNMGSSSCLKLLNKIPYVKRIGLSATPERQFDEIGNQAICSFFGCSLNAYTFSFTMKEAIDKDYLCHYRYYPYIVELNEEEMDAYKELSAKIAKFYNPDEDHFSSNQLLTALLLKRKRIIHKALNKLEVFKRLVTEIYAQRHNLSYLLVYVPEGVDERDQEFTYASDSDLDTDVGQEQISLINQYTDIIANVNEHITVEEVTSKSQNREESLWRFATGETEVLTAMKCLDEGVDVPRTEMAIFCASTGNPRQFVQRRGRILRTHKDKPLAYIYDLVVVPKTEKDSPYFNMERSMLKKELERVIDFASLSTNSSYAEKVLYDTINYYNLNLYSNE